MQKLEIIRSKYKDFLTDATDIAGNKLINHYLPIHLVLTVPHEKGLFNGRRFYAKDLIETFTAMRKTAIWKKYIYAGEYGVKMNNELHIHIHSFLLQNPDYEVNEARKEINELWKRFYTGTTTTISSFHYENLDINPKKVDIDQYLSSVMKCIMIDNILNNTKGNRIYSRFGKFYNVKELDFNDIE